VLELGYHTDPLRGKDSQWSDVFDEIESNDPENEAKFFQRNYSSFSKFLKDVRELFQELFWSVEVGESLFVDVSPAPLIIHQSNSIIENGPDLLNLGLGFAQNFYSPVHHRLRFLQAAEEREHLVDDV